jgi:hypothetical protein
MVTNLNPKVLVIRFFVAAMFVLALVPCGFAAITSYDDGLPHSISGGTYGGIDASNFSVVNISGGVIDGNILVTDGATVRLSGGEIEGGLDVGNGCTKAFGSDPSAPEPSSLVAWSGLGAMGLIYAWRRRKQSA